MEEVFVAGPEGRLEGRFHRSENPRAPLVLVLHPNPAQGGSMNNRVTYAIFQAFVNMGFSVLRFNFRGVGMSQGMLDGTGVGELMDAIAAMDWLQGLDSETNQCWIAGYSFGAWIGAQVLMRRPEIQGFVFVSPPANVYDFNFLSPCPASGIIIQGGGDTYVDEPTVAHLAEQLEDSAAVNVEYLMMPTADHMYSQNLKEMHDSIIRMVPELKLKPPKTHIKHRTEDDEDILPNDDY